MAKKTYSVRVKPDIVEALKAIYEDTDGGTISRAIEDLTNFIEQAKREVAFFYQSMTTLFRNTTGLTIHLPIPRIVLIEPGSFAGEEPVGLDRLVAVGIQTTLAKAAESVPLDPFLAPNLLAVWGTHLGKALGLDDWHAVGLGEFCRSWVYGISDRFGQDAYVGELLTTFSSCLYGKELEGIVFLRDTERAYLFPVHSEDEIPLYRRAWHGVIAVARGIQEGKYRLLHPRDLAYRTEEGVRAATDVLREILIRESMKEEPNY